MFLIFAAGVVLGIVFSLSAAYPETVLPAVIALGVTVAWLLYGAFLFWLVRSIIRHHRASRRRKKNGVDRSFWLDPTGESEGERHVDGRALGVSPSK